MQSKHDRFAREYVVDHNATQAAIRAGYVESRAKQTGYRLLRRPDIAQLVEKLDAEKRDELGVSAQWWMEQAKAGLEKAFRGAPKVTRDGDVVRVEGEPVWQWNPMAHAKYLELIAKAAGLFAERSVVEQTGEVVYTLTLDRSLEEGSDAGGD